MEKEDKRADDLQNREFKETEILELKTSTAELKEAIVAICAMLNKHQKGEIYFGIKNNGTVVGQEVSDKTLRDISKSISDGLEPKIYPRINEIELNGRKCVQVSFEGQETPYFANGRVYTRVGTENKQTSAQELKNFILKKNRSKWEEQLSEKTINDVNSRVFKDYIARANEAKRIDFRFTNTKAILNKLALIKNDKLLRATELLFCNENSLEVQAAVFAGKDKFTFIDIQQFKGTLFDVLKKSENYIKEHMNWRADLSGSRRVEIPEVPLRALTEALVNSLCHRDYTNPKGNEVAIFKDRIEIYNPGEFPEGIKIEDYIKGEERSILRNPIIANTLFLSRDIERWGSGLKRIYDECKSNNVKVEFKILKTGFLVIFYRKEDFGGEKTSGQIGGQIGGQILTFKQQKILELIERNPKVSRGELSGTLKINSSAVQKHIEKLKEKGFIRRIGPDRGGYWKVIKARENKEK